MTEALWIDPLWRALTNPTLWMGYNLDGNENISVAASTVLTGLFIGCHYLTVYANGTVVNTGVSETVYFDIEALFQ